MNDTTLLVTRSVGIAIIGLLLLLLLNLRWRERRRRGHLSDAARAFGFVEVNSIDRDLDHLLKDCLLLGSGHSPVVSNRIQGKYRGYKVVLFEYSYVTGHGKRRTDWTQTVLRIHTKGHRLPQFLVRPKTDIEQCFGWAKNTLGDIDFPDRREFTRSYLLNGGNVDAVRKIFTDAVLAGFEQRPGLCVEVCGQNLLIYRHDRRIDADQFRALLEDGVVLLNLMTTKADEQPAQQINTTEQCRVPSVGDAPMQPAQTTEPIHRRLLRSALVIVWFVFVTFDVVNLLIFASRRKTTEDGVTVVDVCPSYFLIFFGVCLGIAASFVLWELGGRYLVARSDDYDAFARKRAPVFGIVVPCFTALNVGMALTMVISLRLDLDGIEAKTLIHHQQTRFDGVSHLLVTKTHAKRGERSRNVRFKYTFAFIRTNGAIEEWEASTIRLVDTELRDILKRRNIDLFERDLTQSVISMNEITPIPPHTH